MKEIESELEKLECKILIEKNKEIPLLEEKDIREFYEQALKL